MNSQPVKHLVLEGLPAVGKSEVLELLARFYPDSVRVLPELVKSVVIEQGLDLFRDRARLTEALIAAAPARQRRVEEILTAGYTCIEESHLGVHYAYAQALDDQGFLDAYPALERAQHTPDTFLRLDVPLAVSAARQRARGTPEFMIDLPLLRRFERAWMAWHAKRSTSVLTIDADRPPSEVVRAAEDALGLEYWRELPDFPDVFDVLLLLGRPASGKSEFIDFFTRCPSEVRAHAYHIGPFHVVDDFPVLWSIFEADDLWEQMGRGRLHSKRCDGNYAVADDGLWRFLIERINQIAARHPRHASRQTLIIEFSRGGATGYRDALRQLSDDLLARAAILYVSVSFEESWRRNLARYDEKRRSGILTHSVPREEMERTYGEDDWLSLTREGTGIVSVRHHQIPYATLPNEPESKDPAVLGPRYLEALDPLFEAWRHRRPPT